MFSGYSSLTARENEITALDRAVGGKSTVTRLAAHGLGCRRGLDHHRWCRRRDIPTTKLMEMTSMVFQDVYLFNNYHHRERPISVPTRPTPRWPDALRRAGARPDDCPVAGRRRHAGREGGQKLSGGERQRLDARAFLKELNFGTSE